MARLAPLIQRTFHAADILVSRLRDEMLEAGEQEEVDAMVVAACGLQDKLLDGLRADGPEHRVPVRNPGRGVGLKAVGVRMRSGNTVRDANA